MARMQTVSCERNPDPSEEDIRKAGIIGAVRNASLDIAEGEIFVIMGLSGSGKSTLVRCLSRLIEPTGGEVLFDGVDLLARQRCRDDRDPPPQAGHGVPAFRPLAASERAAERDVPPDRPGRAKNRRPKPRPAMWSNWSASRGREDYYPRELVSGGQQQRVGIARSLVTEPDLWFLDEPFSALDPLIRREMQDEFLSLQARLHKTIVFITHDFDEAVRLADRIAIMKDGKIIQVATPEELVVNPASDYVEEFTRHIPRSKVLTAGG